MNLSRPPPFPTSPLLPHLHFRSSSRGSWSGDEGGVGEGVGPRDSRAADRTKISRTNPKTTPDRHRSSTRTHKKKTKSSTRAGRNCPLLPPSRDVIFRRRETPVLFLLLFFHPTFGWVCAAEGPGPLWWIMGRCWGKSLVGIGLKALASTPFFSWREWVRKMYRIHLLSIRREVGKGTV